MTIPAGEGPPWIDERHLMHAGLLAGTLLAAGVSAQPVYDTDHHVTPILHIEKDGFAWAVIVMPEDSTTGTKPEPEAKPVDGT